MKAALYANQIRANILRTLPTATETQAMLLRPADDGDPFAEQAAPERIGRIRGYRYVKREDGTALGIAGELADCFDTEWFIDFEQSHEIRRGDLLQFGGEMRRVKSVRSGIAGIYKICRLEKMQ